MTATPEPSAEFTIAQRTLDAQPFSALIGARLLEFGGGVATLEIPFRDDLSQQNGFFHGGLIAYAIDNTISFAAGTVLGVSILTSGITATYLRPANSTLTATATVVGSTRRQAVVRCEVWSDGPDGASRLVASGQGTVSVIGAPGE
jgi:uncharacterized protein (TIGR00369 family)